MALAATFNKEDTDIYTQFYSFIKAKYNFDPVFITCAFSKSNITAINKTFENCLIITCKDIKTIFEFDIWSYYGKFDFKNQRKKYLISEEALDEYIFLSNNACESCNNLINNYLEINKKLDYLNLKLY